MTEEERRDAAMLAAAPTIEVARLLRIRTEHRAWLLGQPKMLMPAITREDARIARARDELASRAGR